MKISEVFDKINDEQREVIKQISIMKSKENFKISKYRGVLEDSWIYGGCYDTGKVGNGKCSNGHSLRYVHMAVNTKTGEEIMFGIKCIHEFFNINIGIRDEIEIAFKTTNKILKEIYSMIYINNYNYEDKKAMIDFIEKYSNSDGILNIKEMKMLIKAKLPIPWFMAVDLDIKYKTLDKQLKAKKMLENNMELNTAVTLYELIKENIDPIQFNWELSTMKSIKEFLFDNGNLSDKQIALFIKLANKNYSIKDYSDARNKLNTLLKLRLSIYDNEKVYSLNFQLNDRHKLSDPQLKLIDSLWYKYRKQIEQLKTN